MPQREESAFKAFRRIVSRLVYCVRPSWNPFLCERRATSSKEEEGRRKALRRQKTLWNTRTAERETGSEETNDLHQSSVSRQARTAKPVRRTGIYEQ
jgi:hypothetical protein